MKPIFAATLLTLCAASGVQSQGLLSIGPIFDDGQTVRFGGTYTSSLGWDSNPRSGFSGRGGGDDDSEGSAFWSNGISLVTQRGKPDNRLLLNGSYSNTWYLDTSPGTEDMAHNGRLGLNYSRQLSRRWRVSNSFNTTYSTDPEFDVGETVNRRTGGSLYLSNNLSASCIWTHRISTVTGYSFSTVMYDDESGGETDSSLGSEEFIRNGVSQQFRYILDRRTTLTASYRFSQTNYSDDSDGDSRSHFFLFGGDRAFERGFSISGSGGVQYREYIETGEGRASPYGEAALNYRRDLTSVRWHHRVGMEDTGNAARAGQQGGDGGYSYRTGLSLSHQFSRRLSFNASANYVYQTFPRGFGGEGDNVEETVDGRLGLHYKLRRRVGMGFNYYYTTVISDNPFEEYDRHRFSLGVTIAL